MTTLTPAAGLAIARSSEASKLLIPSATVKELCDSGGHQTKWPGATLLQPLSAMFPRMTIIFDGSCGLCRPVVAVLRRLDVRRVVEFLDLHSDWPIIQRRFPALSRDACLTEMHGIDPRGRVFTGFDTYRALAWMLPAGWLVLPLLYLPGVRWTGRRAFRAIADHRHDTVCGTRTDAAPAPNAPDGQNEPMERPARPAQR